MQATDNGFEALNQFGIAVSDIAEFLGLIAKYSKDFFSGFACIDLRGEWVFAEVFLSLFGVFFNGSNEDGFEVGGSGGRTRTPNCGHGATY